MVSQQGLVLAEHIIKSHFGELVAKVARCLLHRGSLPLADVENFTNFDIKDVKEPKSLVKKCLLILIQHNCVQAFSVPEVGRSGTLTHYMALFDNIVQRLRFPKFLYIVNADLGEKCELLLEGLLQHGRLTFDQLVERAISTRSGAVRKDVLADLNILIRAKYVERCPRPVPFITPEDASLGKKRSKTFAGIFSIEQQASRDACVSYADRFSEISDIMTDSVTGIQVTDHSPGISVGDKRKHEEIGGDNDMEVIIPDNEVLWRANFEKFVFYFKKKTCVGSIKSKFGLDAGVVLEAMIEANREGKAKDNNSVVSSMDDILEATKGKPGGASMTVEKAARIILQLVGQMLHDDGETLFTINLKGIIETTQNDEIETLVKKKYGEEAHRIFRLLASKKILELKRVIEGAFVESAKAQEILFSLWKDEYLDMKKVNTARETGGNWQDVLWKINKSVIWEHILNDMYHAALNISIRYYHMIEENLELGGPYKDLSQLQRKRREAMVERLKILQLSLSKVDEGIMLFHDFCQN